MTPCLFEGVRGNYMAKYNNQKAKILFLQQMLYETGENNTISMQMILDTLMQKGIRAERKSIYDDMEVLRYFGMDIRYRRERPSGYYLAGFNGTAVKMPEPVIAIDTENASDEASQETAPAETQTKNIPEEAVQETAVPDRTAWMQQGKSDGKKQMKLQCSVQGRKSAQEYFGKGAEVKYRDDGTYSVSVPLQEDSTFFGWVTAQGGEVRIIKPKKTAQAYRDYLKTLIKDYKQ